MYENPDFDERGEKLLCETGGKNAEMLMTVRVKQLRAGESVHICDAANETAVLLLAGEVEFSFDRKLKRAVRRNPFEDRPSCLHFSKGLNVQVGALRDSRILIQQTENERDFGFVWYAPEDVLLQEFGKGQWNGTAHRQVLTLFDYENAPYSNMVLGESVTKPGCWSSYPPHWHPQPEVYYYEFDRPQGFGVGFDGDDCFKVEHTGALCIRPMHTHQQASAPGYQMCYVWMVRHLPGDPWRRTRINDPKHEWLFDLR